MSVSWPTDGPTVWSAPAMGDQPAPLVPVRTALESANNSTRTAVRSALGERLDASEAFVGEHRLQQRRVGPPPVGRVALDLSGIERHRRPPQVLKVGMRL